MRHLHFLQNIFNPCISVLYLDLDLSGLSLPSSQFLLQAYYTLAQISVLNCSSRSQQPLRRMYTLSDAKWVHQKRLQLAAASMRPESCCI